MKPNPTPKVLFILLVFNGRFNPSRTVVAAKQIHDTFSLLCQDQIVKVDSNIYHLDRLNSSLKSEYFEKLFTSEDFKRKNDPILEIRPLNNEVFPAILDIIHGKEIHDVLNKDNYLSLLKELNNFGMEIDLQIFSSLIDCDLKSSSPQDAKIFELYAFVIQNSQFVYLTNSILKYLSNHVDALQNHEILSSNMSLDHLVQIITNLEDPDENIRYSVVQMCSEWLCHDMKNRLPYMAQLVRKTKLLYRESEEMYSDFSKCLPSCDLDKQARRKMISACFFAMIANGGKLHPTTPEEEYNYDSCNRYGAEDSSDKSEETEITYYSYQRYANNRYNVVKLNEFRKNGDLYDITIRVGEKAYKLHRRILESKPGYFRDIFRAEYSDAIAESDGTPTTCPSKDKEYLISDEIDPSTFEDVMSFVYGSETLYTIFKRFEYKWDKIIKFLKIVHILRLDGLLENCIRVLTDEHQRANSQDAEQFLNFAHGKSEYESLYVIHFSKHLKEKWPNIDNMSQFCSISLTVLQKMLKSSHFRFVDPHKILDICSKWTYHDIKGRYQFLPQIARVINPLCVVEDDEYTTDALADFNASEEQFVRDRLWKILSSLPYTMHSEKYFKNTSRKLEDTPVFVSLTQNEINVLNADLDVIASIEDSASIVIFKFWRESESTIWYTKDLLLATLINDNLFILSNSRDCQFLVYNFFLKTCFKLRCDFAKGAREFLSVYQHFDTLLNCNNEIYCCSNYGRIDKYSMQFDLWTTFTDDDDSRKENIHYTSDGKTLYRMYEIEIARKELSGFNSQYVVEEYDLRKNSWNRVPGSPLIEHLRISFDHPTRFSMIDDRDFIILFARGKIITSNRGVTTGEEWHWTFHNVPEKGVASLARHEDRLLVLFYNKLYRYYPTNGSLEYKKSVPKSPYYNIHIVAIDRRNMDVGT